MCRESVCLFLDGRVKINLSVFLTIPLVPYIYLFKQVNFTRIFEFINANQHQIGWRKMKNGLRF